MTTINMNLGDGLTFELVNGKPQLKLTNRGVEGNLNKIPFRHKPQNVLNSKHQNYKEPVSEEPTRVLKKHIDIRRKATVPSTQAARDGIPLVASNPSHPRVRDATGIGTKGVSRVPPSHRHRQNTTDGSSRPQDAVQESIVCLTSSQLEQILTSIKNASSSSTPSQDTHSWNTTGIGEESRQVALTNRTGTSGEGETLESHTVTNNGRLPVNQEEDRMGLFTALGEREKDKDALEAQKTQYRRDLDEQVAFKRQQRVIPKVPEDDVRRTGPGIGDTGRLLRSAQSYSSQRDLPAAIRSAFVLGEASPSEHAFSAQKKEQQRVWLQELNKQIEEDKLRRRLERQLQSQIEDHEHWNTHFDSLQKRLPTQPPLPPAPERGESGALSSLSHQRALSGALSLNWEVASTCGGESLDRASVDTLGGQPQRARRTMTALLDPVQIEERERNRLKGQEHMRAIEVQVEERRRQREQEAAARLLLEEQDGRRLELERLQLEQQDLLDMQKKREEEELKVRQTEQLYQSVQRAQEAAVKDKHQKRVRQLAQKSHNVSQLQRSLEEASHVPPTTRDSSSPRQELVAGVEVGSSSMTSPRKDIAVLTDSDSIHRPAFLAPDSSDRVRSLSVQTPDIPGEHGPLPPLKVERSRRDARQAPQRPQGAGKENRVGGRGVAAGAVDLYEPFAKSGGGAPGTQGDMQRPGWNTQRPSRRFVPASERYPPGLQQKQQESRLRRQKELMIPMERKASSRTPQPNPDLHPPHPGLQPPLPGRLASLQPPHSSQPKPTKDRTRASSPRKEENVHIERGSSPPVPAVKHRLQAQTQQAHSPPLQAEFVPYTRTDEVYHLDPLAPLSRPPTQPQQQTVTHSDVRQRAAGTTVLPVLNPDLRNPARQQAILKGLSELRQGLLQKQRELESGLDPSLKFNEGNHAAPFQHVTHSP